MDPYARRVPDLRQARPVPPPAGSDERSRAGEAGQVTGWLYRARRTLRTGVGLGIGEQAGPGRVGPPPGTCATRETDMHSRARGEVSCRHRHRKVAQGSAARAPPAVWASSSPAHGAGAEHRPAGYSLGPQDLQKGSSKPVGVWCSITTRFAVRIWPTAVIPGRPCPERSSD
ncbi:hypothetical protein HMPREF1549_03152 [Actinomyces johnsonii F0510]|uniref:Uncharacterized protein n=1 Tax=Actinomyces johnsonii F0510 TaxID=1227262 RepID=U1R7B4_9ACTO|nr:hypothetical protein HMPREF1549_03152 [Actinomyces johnsonii F0510]